MKIEQEGDSDAAAMSGDALVLETILLSAKDLGETCALLSEQVRLIIDQEMKEGTEMDRCIMLKELVLLLMQNAVILKFNLPPKLVTQLTPGVLLKMINEPKLGRSFLLELAKSYPESLKSIPHFGR